MRQLPPLDVLTPYSVCTFLTSHPWLWVTYLLGLWGTTTRKVTTTPVIGHVRLPYITDLLNTHLYLCARDSSRCYIFQWSLGTDNWQCMTLSHPHLIITKLLKIHKNSRGWTANNPYNVSLFFFSFKSNADLKNTFKIFPTRPIFKMESCFNMGRSVWSYSNGYSFQTAFYGIRFQIQFAICCTKKKKTRD